jgi:uncharacterized membrane protein YhhN
VAQPLLVFGVILSASITIAAHYFNPPRRKLIYIFKPFATILILLIALWPQTFLQERYAGAVALGLLFSLAGDVWLMLPGEHFLAGLVSFLLAHLCYVVAFVTEDTPRGLYESLIPLTIIAGLLLIYLRPGLPPNLKWPVVAYVAVIVAMTALAISRAATFLTSNALLAAVGALFFMASDSVLAVERFRRPFYWAKAAVLSTYFLAQTLIALSVS